MPGSSNYEINKTSQFSTDCLENFKSQRQKEEKMKEKEKFHQTTNKVSLSGLSELSFLSEKFRHNMLELRTEIK